MSTRKISGSAYRAALGIVTILIGLGVASSILAHLRRSTSEPPSTIIFEKDIVYSRPDGKPLLIDVARPKSGTGPFPAVLCLHGGGWRAGDKSEFHEAVFSLAQQGYVAATVDYRLAPENHFPSQIQDVKTAVRYLRNRAEELRLDSDHIGVLGGSAGAHLALLLGTTDDRQFRQVDEYPDVSSSVQAVVSLAGPTDLTRRFPHASEAMIKDFIGKSRIDEPAAYEQASPLYHLRVQAAPVLAIHGTKDDVVPYEQTTALVAAFQNLGVEIELFTIPDGGHGSGGRRDDWNTAIVKMVRFFDRHLKNASTSAARPTGQ